MTPPHLRNFREGAMPGFRCPPGKGKSAEKFLNFLKNSEDFRLQKSIPPSTGDVIIRRNYKTFERKSWKRVHDKIEVKIKDTCMETQNKNFTLVEHSAKPVTQQHSPKGFCCAHVPCNHTCRVYSFTSASVRWPGMAIVPEKHIPGRRNRRACSRGSAAERSGGPVSSAAPWRPQPVKWWHGCPSWAERGGWGTTSPLGVWDKEGRNREFKLCTLEGWNIFGNLGTDSENRN